MLQEEALRRAMNAKREQMDIFFDEEKLAAMRGAARREEAKTKACYAGQGGFIEGDYRVVSERIIYAGAA